MQDLNDLYYFVQVVEHGGFSAASRALAMPKSKLSRRIALLEQRLAVRLIQRSTRHFNVTDLGKNYYQHCKAMLIEAETAQELIDASKAEPRGTIKMTCPITLLHAHVSRMLAEFMAKYPQISIQLEATNRSVDLLAEGLDLALRVRPPPLADSDLVLRVLSDRGQLLVASPALVAKFGLPQVPEALQTWPSLGLSSKASPIWTLFNAEGEQRHIRHQPRLMTSDMMTLRHAALQGIGLVQLPALMLTEDLAAGRLLRVLPDWQPRREIIHLVFPSRRGLLPSVRLLVEHLASSFAAMDED